MRGMGKEKGGTAASGQQSWRELAGPRKQRINSPQARRRRQTRLLKVLGGFLMLLALIAGVTWVVIEFQGRKEKISLKAPSKPIERILFETNGLLPDAWLSSVVSLKAGMTMMEADIYGLKQKLEAQGQVKSATVERVFPADLRIVVQERTPVLRLAIADATGKRRLRIVGEDGVVYDGVGYPQSALKQLPFVRPFQHSNGKFFPLLGIERVAELLNVARQKYPQLSRGWQVVSLEHYSGDLELPGQVIEIHSVLVPRILFSASTDFGKQLDRLEYIMEYVEQRGNPSMERIDLSLNGAAAVQFSSGRVGNF